ncbi:hypothetical protein [Verrucomicrobium spinosum]|uniref:hypothetical protein n=1 Tax=Verrucomicrobium spinosum TaxID=2736 RepID=UPI000AA38E3C|nr:hypothetical protein [Verrucomicrobium spinosum]
MQRRDFLSTTLATLGASALPALATGPVNRPGKSRMMLGLAAYSFREYFKWMRGKEQKPRTASRSGRSPISLTTAPIRTSPAQN